MTLTPLTLTSSFLKALGFNYSQYFLYFQVQKIIGNGMMGQKYSGKYYLDRVAYKTKYCMKK